MTNELELLKECPFQKEGETHKLEWVDVGSLKWVRCKTCLAQGPCDASEQRAAELWNTRYKRTCKMEPDPDYDMVICSECGYEEEVHLLFPSSGNQIFDGKFCPSCGAEVSNG